MTTVAPAARNVFRRWRERFVAAACLIVVAAICASCTPAGEDQRRMQQEGAMTKEEAITDFNTLSRSTNPNNWLIAPPSFTAAKADETAPVFDRPAEAMASAWLRVIETQPRTKLLAVSADGLQIESEQRSALFGFVDRISVRFVPLQAGTSTLIAYSRSQVGYWDMGVNRERLRTWIAALAGA